MVLTPLKGVDPRRYSICLLGPVALGLSLGIQFTLTALLAWGPADARAVAAQLTEHGRQMARPEHDLLIFLAGATLTMIAVVAAVWYWRARLVACRPAEIEATMRASSLQQGVLAVMSLLICSLLASSCWFSKDFHLSPNGGRPVPDAGDWITILLPGVLALFCAVVDLESGWLGSSVPAKGFEFWRRRAHLIFLFAVPLFVVLVVGVPPGRWGPMADQFFGIDLHHHLNFFMMGPALLFVHGKAFGTEIYSQYGIGWPLVACGLFRLSLLSYGTLIGLEVVYVCFYYVALFFVLRACFKEATWAALGVGLAIYWQIFSGMNPNETIWIFPSSTAMRHPMDIWFFLGVVMHQRTGKLVWAALAGLAAGLGVLFETETGIYLVVTFLVYVFFQTGLARGEQTITTIKQWLLALLAFFVAALAAFLPFAWHASRGALLSRAFWHGWMEALGAYAGQGVGALPIAELPDSPFMMFAVMVTLYLGIIAYAVIRAWHRSLGRGTALLATIAAYGLALLLLFVNRSHPFNLCHAAVPLAVISAALVAQGCTVLQRHGTWSSLPWVMVAGVAVLIFLKPEFQRYPSCLRTVIDGAPSTSPMVENYPGEFGGITAAIRALPPSREDVAILDFNDTALCYLSDTRPWSRFGSAFYMMLTPQILEDFERGLMERPPRYVVIRGKDFPRPPKWEFVWGPLYEIVSRKYQLLQTEAPYEIWQISGTTGAGK